VGYELGTVALILVGVAAWVKIFLINPYNAARHVINVVNPNADVEAKDESKDAIKAFATDMLSVKCKYGRDRWISLPIPT